MFDSIILGAGPAGLTAGIYFARAQKNVMILDIGTVGGAPVLTHLVANYPGVPEIAGYSLSQTMKKQAESFGCKIKGNAKIDAVSLKGEMKTVSLTDGTIFEAPTVVIATGGTPRRLGIPGEDKFKGKGVSYCATCDGDFFTDKEIVVIGGGNSALEEAVSLSKYASKITILHEFDHFQAFKSAIKDAEDNEKINFIMDVRVQEFVGENKISALKYKDNKTGENHELQTAGVFVFIGYVPSSEKFEGMIDINGRGEIVTDEDMLTSLPGVYAAGDIRVKRIRQLTTAVSDGTIAALNAIHYMESK
jgi:thioredoxin reductase (NADPH)